MPVFSCVCGGEGMPVSTLFEYMLRFEGAVVVAGEQFDWPRLLGKELGLQGAGPAGGPNPDLEGEGADPKKRPESGPKKSFFCEKTLFYDYSKNHYSKINRVPPLCEAC